MISFVPLIHLTVISFNVKEGPALEVVEEIKKSGGDAVAVKADCEW
jgi:hypothetical protein